jgi:K+/H+ antiporter YhaU regulatory subunit KhtT
LNQTLQNKKSVDPSNKKFDEKSQRQSDKSQIAALQNKKSIDPNNKKSDEKPQATTSSKDKEKPSMAKALSGMQQNAVNTAKEQAPQQTAKPMNEHLQGKVTGAIQGRATGKDGNGQ